MSATGNLELIVADIARVVVREELERQPVQPRLFTVKQAAKYLGRSPDALYHLIRNAPLRSVKADGRVMLDRQDLDKWIEDNKS